MNEQGEIIAISRRLHRLELRVKNIEGALELETPEPLEDEVAPASPAPAATLPVKPPAPIEILPPQAVSLTPATPDLSTEARPLFSTPFKKERSDSQSWNFETLVGGNLLNRIGIVALFLGFAFFFKLAIDKGWISPALRIAFGFLSGIGMIVGGEILTKKNYSKFAAGLLGGGIGILYFTVFAGYHFYGFFGLTPAFLLDCLVTAAGVFLSLRHGWLAIAVLSQIGGFLTPAMLNSGEDKLIALGTYLLLLDAGMLWVAFKKDWRVLERIGWFGTTALMLGWSSRYYHDERLVPTFIFATVFYLLFYAVPLARGVWKKISASPWDLFAMVGLSSMYFWAAFSMLDPQHETAVRLLGFGLALFQAGSGWLLQKKSNIGSKVTPAATVAFALSGLSFTFFLWRAFEQTTLTALLSGWALALTLLSIRKENIRVGLAALAIHVWTLIRLVVFHADTGQDYHFLLNSRVVAFGAEALSLLAAGFLAQCWNKKDFLELPFSVGALLLAALLGCEGAGLFDASLGHYPWKLFVWAPYPGLYSPIENSRFALWVCTAATFFASSWALSRWLGRNHSSARTFWVLAWVGLGLNLAAECGGLLNSAVGENPLRFLLLSLKLEPSSYAPVLNGRAAFFSLYALTFLLLPRMEGQWSRVAPDAKIQKLMTLFGSFLLLILFSSELLGCIDPEAGANPWGALFSSDFRRTGAQTALTLSWVLYALGAIAIGIARKNATLRYFALALFGVAIFKVVVVDLANFELIYRVISMIGLGLILIAASWLYHRFVIGPEQSRQKDSDQGEEEKHGG